MARPRQAATAAETNFRNRSCSAGQMPMTQQTLRTEDPNPDVPEDDQTEQALA